MFEAIEGMIEQKLLNLHTAFVAEVVSVKKEKGKIVRKIQPVSLSKQYGEKPEEQAVIEGVPRLANMDEVEAGDIVFCVCAERDICDSKKGIKSAPPPGRHSLNDAVIIGVIEE